MLSKKKEKKKQLKIMHLKKYQSVFTTVDGVAHAGCSCKWVNSDGISCTVQKYLMMLTIEDGYLMDDDKIMYPLQNILSIDWKLIGSKVALDNFYHEFQVMFSNNEVEEMTEYDN